MDELTSRIAAFAKLGLFLDDLSRKYEPFEAVLQNAEFHNAWFTKTNVLYAYSAWAKVLKQETLANWLNSYEITNTKPKNVGIIGAGNIPLVVFHDILSVLLLGHRAIVKLSHKDAILIVFIVDFLKSIYPDFEEKIVFTEGKLSGYDAIIATGSGNSSRYFEYYFGNVPNIIRKNRSALAILSGKETQQDFEQLGIDIFTYFGLGCRNVCKLFVPRGYDFSPFLQALECYKEVINHHKYANNYDYNKAVYLMGNQPFLDTGFVLLREDVALKSPLGVLFYEYYDDENLLFSRLDANKDYIQCVVSNIGNFLAFGQTQTPSLTDYADGVDTIAFLKGLGT